MCSLAHSDFDDGHFFSLMNGNTERAHCALSRVCILKKRKKKVMKSNINKKKKVLRYLKKRLVKCM